MQLTLTVPTQNIATSPENERHDWPSATRSPENVAGLQMPVYEGPTWTPDLVNKFLLSIHLMTTTSHLSASTLRSEPARIMTCQCLRSSAISVVIWFLAISSFTRSRHLSFGLPRFLFPSTSICNIFLVASSLSLLCTWPNQLNLFSLRNSAIGYMCASLWGGGGEGEGRGGEGREGRGGGEGRGGEGRGGEGRGGEGRGRDGTGRREGGREGGRGRGREG